MRHAFLLLAVLAAGACSDDRRLVVRTVSEYSGTPVAGIRVQVEGQPWATTGADGKAAFDRVSGPFTVRVHQSFAAPSGNRYEKAFELRGRTGNDLEVEVDGSPGWHRAEVTGTVIGRSGGPSSEVLVQFPNASDGFVLAVADPYVLPGVEWQGAPSSALTLRAIEADPADPPGHYYGYGTGTAAVSDGVSTVGVQLALAPVTEGAVAGTASLPASLSSAALHARTWLAFSRHDKLGLQRMDQVVPSPSSFSRILPQVAGASAWMRLSVLGQSPGAGLAGASSQHARRVEVPSSGVAFDLPAPVDLLEPAPGAGVGAATVFRWSAAPPGGSYTLFLYCDWTDAVGHSVGYRGVEATGTEVGLPAIPSLTVAPGAACRWSVLWCAAADPALEVRCSWSAERPAVAT